MAEDKLRAYTVNSDEHSCIVFAKSHVEARRVGAQELDGDFEGMESCKLTPEFDKYAPGPVPIQAMIESGWWYECSGCSRRVDSDNENFDEEEEEEGSVPPELVYVGNTRVYCSQACLDRETARWAKEKADKEFLIAKATEQWPGIEVVWTSCYSEPHIIDFRFPGGKHGVRWTRDAKTVLVTPLDQEAWKIYVDGVKEARKNG